ncbi:hypothetical protein C922_00978 [Plasmodium inui San Antonio 1]|uniref:ABM domain-containing protein n=1 Tax=Plasmodium inui San Antonio 1 TaxID=1237626 RepID=W7AHU3_9APIC|nr:hypothetical protein C922_00978 [Plasmodium inui San Antonio 1]EUD68579.1 hypothetical protein C922_00978 [Plasmodium inui San Antonio 1]
MHKHKYKHILYGLSGALSGWVLRDLVICLSSNLSLSNGMLINKFICSKDDFVKNILHELKYCFDSLELKKGFNDYHIYTKENDHFVETLYIENWNNTNNMNEHLYSEDSKKSLHYLKKINILFSPSLFVLLRQYPGRHTPAYLKSYFE